MNEITHLKHTSDTDDEPAQLKRLREALNAASVNYTILTHELAIRSAQEGVEQGFGELSNMAPTFILQTEAGYLAAITRGDTRLSYKKLRLRLKLKNICLATPEQVQQVTGAEVGHVSLWNAGLRTILDSSLTELGKVYGGCGATGYTLVIEPKDLIALTGAQVFDFTEPKSKT